MVCECVSGYGWLVVNDSDSHGATAAPAASLRDFRRQAATHLPCDLLAQEVRAARGVLGLKFHATPIIHNCGCICEMQSPRSGPCTFVFELRVHLGGFNTPA